MNTLSWFIYLADIVDRFSGMLTAIAIISGVIAALSLIAYTITISEPTEYSWTKQEQRDWWKTFRTNLTYWIKRLVATCIITGTLVTVIPSKQTMYLIAGSEIGQRVVTSEQVQRVTEPTLGLVEAYLKEQIRLLEAKRTPQQNQ